MTTLSRRSFLAGSASTVALAGCATPRATASSPAAAARRLYDAILEEMLAATPELATGLGLDTGARAALKSRLSDPAAGRLGVYRPLADASARLEAIPRDALTGRDRGWLDTARWFAARARETAAIPYGAIGGYDYPVPYVLSQLTGSYQTIPSFLDGKHRIQTAADAEAYLARLDQFGRNIDADVARAGADAAAGVIPPGFIVEKAVRQTRSLRAERGAEAGLVRSLAGRAGAANIPGDWEARAARLVDGPIAAALGRQLALLDGWRARAGTAAGVSALPQGGRFYEQALRFHTSTNMSPAEIHRSGLEQIAALIAGAEPLLRAAGLTQGSVGARIAALQETDRQLFPDTEAGRAELLTYLRGLVAQLRARMPDYFHTLPASGMEVRRVPPAIELGSPGAYAESGSLDGTRPGVFYINLAATAAWPRRMLPTLTCHEAIPGHLWQGAIVNAAAGIPLLHRSVGIPAFGEGWGLYAETLGDELGLYAQDPLGRIGMIQSLLFRAVRLVVDTGMHAMGWSRERAIQTFMGIAGRERGSTEREIDRYIVWPGQACAYKIGHNEMLRIRADAKARLGARFDLKAFHELVLLSGDMPLEVLATMAAEWEGSRVA